MSERRFVLFQTAIGTCGLGWSEAGIFRVHLPERTAEASRALFHRRHSDILEAPPTEPIRDAIFRIEALLRGEPADLDAVAIDLAGVTDFAQRVYRATRAIPPGRTATYGEIADTIGAPGEARAVGQALGRNPVPILVPCHRVLAADGKVGGFSAEGGVETKLRMLTIERAATSRGPSLFDTGDWPLAARPGR